MNGWTLISIGPGHSFLLGHFLILCFALTLIKYIILYILPTIFIIMAFPILSSLEIVYVIEMY